VRDKMPKLSHPKITKGDAIATLLNLYTKERNFMKELNQIRQPYKEIVNKFIEDISAFFKGGSISLGEYYQAVMNYYKGDRKKDPLPVGHCHYLSQLQPYLDAFSKLAHKWKLRAPWILVAIWYFDLVDFCKAKGLPAEIDIPLEKLEQIYPWAPPLPALEIKIPAWAIILFGRKAIQTEINEKLQEYENKIKLEGLHEYPSALNTHAQRFIFYLVY